MHFSLVFRHLLKFIVIAFLLLVSFLLSSTYNKSKWYRCIWILRDSNLIHQSFIISNIDLINSCRPVENLAIELYG